MKVLERGTGELLAWYDPDEHRRWVQKNKSARLEDKVIELDTAVSKYIPDGSYLASGGFGHVRVSMALIYEMIRQKKEI